MEIDKRKGERERERANAMERVLKEREGTSWGRDGGLSKCKQEEERELVERERVPRGGFERVSRAHQREREREWRACVAKGGGRVEQKRLERERVCEREFANSSITAHGLTLKLTKQLPFVHLACFVISSPRNLRRVQRVLHQCHGNIDRNLHFPRQGGRRGVSKHMQRRHCAE